MLGTSSLYRISYRVFIGGHSTCDTLMSDEMNLYLCTSICVQLIKIQGFHSIASTNNHDGSLYSGLHWDLLGWTRPLASSGRLWGSFFRFVWLWGLCPLCFLPYIYLYMLIHTCVSERYHYLMALRKLNELNASGRTSGFLNCTEGRPISIRLGSVRFGLVSYTSLVKS